MPPGPKTATNTAGLYRSAQSKRRTGMDLQHVALGDRLLSPSTVCPGWSVMSHVSVLPPFLLLQILHCMKYFIHVFCTSTRQLTDVCFYLSSTESGCYEHACVVYCMDTGVHFSWLLSVLHTPRVALLGHVVTTGLTF